jgi:hypothetical protein
METSPAPTSPTPTRTSRWPTCCAIALLVLTVLAGLGAWALAELEKGLDGYGQLEQGGASGSVADPLGPDATARYEDGLKITVSAPRREADGTYGFTITYDNGTDEELHLGGESVQGSVSTIGPAPLVVRAGRSLDDYVTDYDLTWLNEEAAALALMPPLAPDDERTIPVHISVTRRGIPVTVEVDVPAAGYRETAYFQITA